ncbi:MAG: CinA family protein [Limimaricola soesokkakensis]|uniref:Nicotinamide-nucleotide amidase n=1 Tax=Limimaricola soesokkakensis TaxID=1343159 RepID=A0A1X6ZEZ3_9RHOB|nr:MULTISPECIES: CinA family protein [Limimaricola]MCZ4260278.1 CinA family protein [Limimaricola sp. G21655-S1]PSK86144.1 nicotinamide-nucleotide amidase [Limimaricola soesokkakensis]SLN49848.1 Nicotinamide-nucleotide amidohydrolase PncC [Limimaricola soesokkakensis]
MGDTARLVNGAREAGLRVATAESCTGGMVAAAITETPGASNVFDWGVVTYSNAAKQALLGVSAESLEAHGAVSEQVADEMARGALERSGADIAVAITGIAGPGASEHKPEGRVCFGVATASGCETETVEFGARGRDTVRSLARDHAIAAVIGAIKAQRRP